MAHRDIAGAFEQQVLSAILRLGHDAYGMKIRQEIERQTQRAVSIGAIYTTLHRLEQKGFVASRQGEPTPERGGRAKRYFRVQAPGINALQRTQEVMTRMWNDVVPSGA